ncbi:hypothetical protein AOQ84DRAFT_341889 [Glonium stellatum]|uniref:SAM and PH domain-containing protein n=1 Tax=Glonium stellatum TaxID=574774 RepID=A0A8E2JS36_9PEZI|nr:hypothetical protein AOQ84DRAFT_341889 [Glonium stellatum]
MQAMTPITPLESGVEMFQRGKLQPFFAARTGSARPLSEATEIYDTDFEDDSSEFEEDYSPKYSFNSNESRKSQTTISTMDEVQTPEDPDSNRRTQFDFDFEEVKPVEGPKGPHLFRASQSSGDFDFALQLSPLLPKQQPPLRSDTAFRSLSPATVVPQREFNSLATAVADLDNSEVRTWTAQQVASWMFQAGFESDIIERFEAHDITGAVLLDLQFDDLKELEIQSFGKRHQLWNQIDALRVNEGLVPLAPLPTPFEDISRPCTGARSRSKSRNRDKSRNREHRRKHRNLADDIITPAESVSIVAIEQLLPKPHKCAKGERCAKWRKQQRQLAKLADEHGFPISPEKGGHIFIAGDPGNAVSANRVVENVYRPTSEAEPSVVASSDLLGPGQLPEFTLQEDLLRNLEQRDPQDNVKQFLSLQHLDQPYMTATPIEAPPSPPYDMFPTQHQNNSSIHLTGSSYLTVPSHLPGPALHPPEYTPAPHSNLKSLPRLNIPRSMSANPHYAQRSAAPRSAQNGPDTAFSPCRTASPGGVYRFGTPCSEMDVPVTAVPIGPVSRDASQSVPPNMQFRDPVQRTGSRTDWRRPSFAMPALNEGEVYNTADNISDSDTLHETISDDATSTNTATTKTEEPSKKSAGGKAKGGFHYDGVNHAGWMKKRRTKLLRHEWEDHHFRLTGTQLAMHPNELPSSSALNTIDVDDYAVACSSLSSNKLAAKLKALKLTSGPKDKDGLPTAFSFQLVPTGPVEKDGRTTRRVMPSGKTHHFAVKTRDERIDWMRELMLAKALKAKGEGYEVNVNGNAM